MSVRVRAAIRGGHYRNALVNGAKGMVAIVKSFSNCHHREVPNVLGGATPSCLQPSCGILLHGGGGAK